MSRFRVIKHRVPRIPMVAWHVSGRKMFDRRYSAAIRAMWGLGRYGI